MNFNLIVPESLNPRHLPMRVAGTQADPLFCLADICRVLDIDQPHRAADRIDEDDRTQNTVIDSLGREQQAWFVNESGFYTLVLRSDKPEAKAFRKWVTKEVLPCVRKHGCYPAPAEGAGTEHQPKSPTSLILEMAKLLHDNEARMDRFEARVEALERELRLPIPAPRDPALLEQGYLPGTFVSALDFLWANGHASEHARRLGIRAARICRDRGVRFRFRGNYRIYPQHVVEEAWEVLKRADGRYNKGRFNCEASQLKRGLC